MVHIPRTYDINISCGNFEKLLNRSERMEQITNKPQLYIKLKNKGKVEKNLFNRFYLTIFLKHVLFLVITSLQTYVWYNFFQLPFVLLFLFIGNFECYIEFLIIVLMHSLVQSLKIRYVELNKKVVKTCRNNISHLKNVCHDYRILGQTVEIFNKIFGYEIILILWHFGVESVNSLTFIFVPYVSTDVHNYFLIGVLKFALFCGFR